MEIQTGNSVDKVFGQVKRVSQLVKFARLQAQEADIRARYAVSFAERAMSEAKYAHQVAESLSKTSRTVASLALDFVNSEDNSKKFEKLIQEPDIVLFDGNSPKDTECELTDNVPKESSSFPDKYRPTEVYPEENEKDEDVSIDLERSSSLPTVYEELSQSSEHLSNSVQKIHRKLQKLDLSQDIVESYLYSPPQEKLLSLIMNDTAEDNPRVYVSTGSQTTYSMARSNAIKMADTTTQEDGDRKADIAKENDIVVDVCTSSSCSSDDKTEFENLGAAGDVDIMYSSYEDLEMATY